MTATLRLVLHAAAPFAPILTLHHCMLPFFVWCTTRHGLFVGYKKENTFQSGVQRVCVSVKVDEVKPCLRTKSYFFFLPFHKF